MDNQDMQKKLILVIDDMPTILEHAKQILKESYKIIPSTSGAQALEIMQRLHPDIVLLDVNMPDMDGYEVLTTIRNTPSLKGIPVIMITTELTNEIETKGFSCGADDFITKPFSALTMMKRIGTQLMLKEHSR